jgi:hypothetical protein
MTRIVTGLLEDYDVSFGGEIYTFARAICPKSDSALRSESSSSFPFAFTFAHTFNFLAIAVDTILVWMIRVIDDRLQMLESRLREVSSTVQNDCC